MNNNELYHHGVLGMKWGVRRYQNEDGTLTEAGRRRLGRQAIRTFKKQRMSPIRAVTNPTTKTNSLGKETDLVIERYKKEANSLDTEKKLNELDKKGQRLALDLAKKQQNNSLTESDYKRLNDFQTEYRKAQIANTKAGHEVAKKYIKDLNQAYVKDLNIQNYEEVADWITSNSKMWDTTYISNYAWFNQLF